MINIITGNCLQAPEKYLVHQTNCVSSGKAGGIARQIFDLFPHSDCYKDRASPSTPGTIDIRGNGVDERLIVNLHGQYYPGRFDDDIAIDTEMVRRNYFHKALNQLAKVKDLESVAFPWTIACGLGGGNWDWYLGELESFEEHVYQSFGVKVSVYRLG